MGMDYSPNFLEVLVDIEMVGKIDGGFFLALYYFSF